MIKQIDDIVNDVRVCLDRNRSGVTIVTPEVGGGTLTVDDIIRSKVLEGVRRVECSAPVLLLDGGHHFADDIHWMDNESGWVLLPEDFMRLMVFMMDDWSKAVYVAVSGDDPSYSFQRSKHKGVRGTADRPECFITLRPEGRSLEFYSCRSERAQISRAMYLPYPKVDAYDGVTVCGRCYDSIVYTIASLTCAAQGEVDKCNLLNELAKGALL